MLVLTRKRNQTLIIGEDIEITVLEIQGDQIRLGVNAPKDIKIYRKELYLEIQEENKSAAKSAAQASQSLKNILGPVSAPAQGGVAAAVAAVPAPAPAAVPVGVAAQVRVAEMSAAGAGGALGLDSDAGDPGRGDGSLSSEAGAEPAIEEEADAVTCAADSE